MSKSNKDVKINKENNKSSANEETKEQKVEQSVEEKLKISEEKLLRSLADSENQRRRFEKEIKDAFDFGGFNFAREMLTSLDNLQRAKKSMLEDEDLKKSKDFPKFLKNIEILEKDLFSTFEKNKIIKIDCLNKMFDPNFHQAMLEVEDEKVEPGTIIQEIQPGFMFGERLLRPSFVGISKKKGEKDDKNK
jgi:molecular chaperone GrpE